MIFVTVGTQFPFDRLVKRVDGLAARLLTGHHVFAQVGESTYKPANMEFVASLANADFEAKVRDCSAVISHAGMGTITMALEHSKPLLVLPRLRKFGEVVNDHQVAIAGRFEKAGHLLAAYSEDELDVKVPHLLTFVPRRREVDPDSVCDVISEFLALVAGGRHAVLPGKRGETLLT
jgi:beta-1,4-N-acetylglucosaminyltransferase